MKNLISFFILTTLLGCNVNEKSTGSNTEDPIVGTAVNKDSAKIMVHNYIPETANLKYNTKCIWLSLNRIDSIYTYLHREQKAGMGTDGVRIYFATYPKEYQKGKPHPHAYRNTILIVSTKDSLGKYHWDYFTYLPNHLKSLPPFVPENKGELTPPGDERGAVLLQP